MTLRAITVLVLSAVLLAVVAGCGSKNASSHSDVELAYSVSEPRLKDRGIFLIDREGKHRRRLLKRVQIPDAQDVHWSPTSDLILFESGLDGVWTIRSDGSDLTKIADDGEASWSPDGTLIAVTRGPAVEILSANGELQKRISTKKEGDESGDGSSTPSWSPDGTSIAFANTSGKYSAIFVARPTGEGGAVAVVEAANNAYPSSGRATTYDAPYWSPDGELLAFVSEKFGSPSIWTMRPDGTHRKRVASWADLLGWAADGRGVLCTGELPDLRTSGPHECPLDGGSWRPLTPEEEKQADERDRYSPDGRQLVTATLSGSIVVSRRDGSAPKVVLTNAGIDSFPEWSPDGSHLAFVREGAVDESSPWVYVVGADGKGARRLVRGESAAWLPGGSELLVKRLGNIFVVTSEGESRRLAGGFTEYEFPHPVVSPDGAMVAFLRTAKDGQGTSTIYATETRGGRERKVLDVPDSEADDLAWSSDGQKLYGVWTTHECPDEVAYATLYEVTLDGSSRVVAKGVNPWSGIAVSPSGDRVAFSGIHGLEVVDLKTGKRSTVVAGGPSQLVDPQWSPDGSTLAYVANDCPGCTPTALETIHADGSARLQVSAPEEVVDSFSWRPASAGD